MLRTRWTPEDVRNANILKTRKEPTKNDKPTSAPLEDFPDHEPNENSSLEELALYALLKQDSILASDKKNGADLWLMGQALEWAFKKTPYGEWEGWFKAQGLKKTYVWQARTLHARATLDEMKKIGMTKALCKFEILPKKTGAGTEASARKKSKDENDLTETPEPNDQDGGGDQDEADEPHSDDLADEADKELKAYQKLIRKLTPKTRAVAIHHALQLLRDELDGKEVDEELQREFGQIAQLAEELKGMNSHDEHHS